MNRPNLAEIFMVRIWLCRTSKRLGDIRRLGSIDSTVKILGAILLFPAVLAGLSFAFVGICIAALLRFRAHQEYEKEQIQTADNNPQAYLRYGNIPRSEPPLFLLARLRRFPNRIRRA